MPRHVLRQVSRTAVKDNQGRRQHALPRRHGHDRITSWPGSPRGSLTAPPAAPGALPVWPLRISTIGISRFQSACSSPTAHRSSCTRVAESITHATYNRLGSVRGPHSALIKRVEIRRSYLCSVWCAKKQAKHRTLASTPPEPLPYRPIGLHTASALPHEPQWTHHIHRHRVVAFLWLTDRACAHLSAPRCCAGHRSLQGLS